MSKKRLLPVLLVVIILLGVCSFLLHKRLAVEKAYIESAALRVVVRDDGKWEIRHKPVDTVWQLGSHSFGRITFYNSETGESKTRIIDSFKSIYRYNVTLLLIYEPAPNVTIEFYIQLVDNETIHLFYRAYIGYAGWSVQSIEIIDESLAVEGENAYVVVPSRRGVIIPANREAFSFDTRDYGKGTYVDSRLYNMAMLGLVQGPSAVAITWNSTEASVKLVGTGSKIFSSIILNDVAKDVYLHFIENGDYVSIAKYYRKVVQDRGFFVTLEEKIERYPETAKLVGAMAFKPGLKLSLSPDASDNCVWKYGQLGINISRGESIVYFTSDEIERIAEHLKYDLKINHASFIIYGWMKGGQIRHSPEWFPVDSDIGGNEGLAEMSRTIQSLNYSFALFTNFEIMYKSSPLTDPSDALVDSSGKTVEVNTWPGGPSYTTSPARQLKYAQINMPNISDIISPNAAFIDMMTVVPLYEDFSQEHLLNQTQTIEKYKELTEYVKSIVNGPLLGEEAYEWSVPFFDSYEGLANFKIYNPRREMPRCARVVPLFELVFRETGVFGTHGTSGIGVTPEPPYLGVKEDLLDFISIGRIPRVHFPHNNLYYETEGVYPTDEVYARADNGWAYNFSTTDRLIKNAYEITSPLNELTLFGEMTDHKFLTQDLKVIKTVFADSYTVIVNKKDSDYTYADITLPKRGFIVDGPDFVAFHAKNYNSINYSDYPLFTIRSLDNISIEDSERIRIYHGFGDKRIAIRNNHPFARINGQTIPKIGDYFIFDIEREATIEFYGSLMQHTDAEKGRAQATETAFEDTINSYSNDTNISISVNLANEHRVKAYFIAVDVPFPTIKKRFYNLIWRHS